MAYIMQTETWLRLTELSGKPRSKYLKGVDQALQKYHATPGEISLSQLKLALHHWKMSKGYDAAAGKPAWMLSPRNRNRACETLDLQTFGISSALTPALVEMADSPFYGIEAWAGEAAARQAMKEARQQALEEMFKGKTVTIKTSSAAWMVESMKRHLKTAKADAQQAADAAASLALKPAKKAARQEALKLAQPAIQQVQPYIQQAQAVAQQMIDEILAPFPVEVAQEVLQFLGELIPQFLVELAGAIAPYLGVAVSGAKAVYYTAQTIRQQYKQEQSDQHRAAFAKGDPFAALVAIQRMLERERNRCARLATINASDAAIKAAAHIADAATFGAPTVSSVVSPLSGMAKAMAILAQQVFFLARDMQEAHAANVILAGTPRLSAGLFEKCPILGCYFVAASTTSNLVNFAVDDLGAVGWNLDVEVLVRRHIHPMVEMARGVISDSRLEVAGMELSKAVAADSSPGVTHLPARIKKQMIDKINAVLPFREMIHRAPTPLRPATAKMGMQPVPAGVLQSRIYGHG